MKKYVGKRIFSVIVTLFVLSLFIFFLTHSTAGDPASNMLGSDATEEQVEQLREELGLNDPLLTQYFNWIADALKGDFGDSYFRKQSVIEAIGECITPTLELALYAEILAIIISIPCGIFAAKKKGAATDLGVSAFALVGLSVPCFIYGLLLILYFGVDLGVLPVSGYKTIEEYGTSEHFSYMVLPIISLALTQAPLLTRITRSSMVEVLSLDYIKTAKAKGLKGTTILTKHAFRNAFNTILTVLGQSIGSLVAGAAVIETLFNIPGMGQLVVNAVLKRDYPLIQGLVLVISLVYIVINFTIDMLYGVIDPRIRVSGKS
ncbi:MAG: ABC transporter permease [Lachnospiraceae bacterium]|nr:ABC transporter permease [Lachnospiraceae bacterium]